MPSWNGKCSGVRKVTPSLSNSLRTITASTSFPTVMFSVFMMHRHLYHKRNCTKCKKQVYVQNEKTKRIQNLVKPFRRVIVNNFIGVFPSDGIKPKCVCSVYYWNCCFWQCNRSFVE